MTTGRFVAAGPVRLITEARIAATLTGYRLGASMTRKYFRDTEIPVIRPVQLAGGRLKAKMATREEHISKYELFWSLAQKQYREGATPFLCMNLIMYTVGHLIEALLAEDGRHPSSPPRGVPHADREALLRKVLIAQGRLEERWADCYTELVARRDTFIDGGMQDRAFVERYMTLAQPFIERLQALALQR